MKVCITCGVHYPVRGRNSKYCLECTEIRRKAGIKRRSLARAKHPGVGKGGAPHRAELHPNFKHGRFTYETTRNEIRAEVGNCERCRRDLREATHYQWVIHHKDHNQYNYQRSNLELLCKRCHQIEHECWRAFEGATTIPQGSRAKRLEAPDTPKG